jgi:hypothetical protein
VPVVLLLVRLDGRLEPGARQRVESLTGMRQRLDAPSEVAQALGRPRAGVPRTRTATGVQAAEVLDGFGSGDAGQLRR